MLGGAGSDLLQLSGSSDTYNGGNGIDTLWATQDVRFVNFGEKTGGLEILDLHSGGANSVALNASDLIDFGATGETVNGNTIGLVVCGDTGGADNVDPQGTGSTFFGRVAFKVSPGDPAYGGEGVLYDVYSDGTHSVAVKQFIAASARTEDLRVVASTP